MSSTLEKDLINQGKICPYCGDESQFIDSKEIYGTSYGMIYACLKCSAWVGVHKGTTVSLGRMANGTLRHYKKEAHAAFDVIWQREIEAGKSKNFARNEAYTWLAEQMGMNREDCHIGMFDENQCIQVLTICAPIKTQDDET
jgi:hypothetical protein